MAWVGLRLEDFVMEIWELRYYFTAFFLKFLKFEAEGVLEIFSAFAIVDYFVDGVIRAWTILLVNSVVGLVSELFVSANVEGYVIELSSYGCVEVTGAHAVFFGVEVVGLQLSKHVAYH
jgi:hypothetical protein